MEMFFVLPFGKISLPDKNIVDLDIFGILCHEHGNNIEYSVLPFLIFIIIVSVVGLVSIFLYKKRVLQMRFCIFNLILQLCSIGFMFYYLHNATSQFGTDYHTTIMIVMPFVAAVFTYLAIRGIAKDEALVRSVSRIR